MLSAMSKIKSLFHQTNRNNGNCSWIQNTSLYQPENGCLEDIPSKFEELKSHDQSCVFQLVTCPTLDCDESIIFKNLNQHLKESHFNAAMPVYSGTETNEYTKYPENFGTFVYGIYHRRLGELINGRNYYEKKATDAGCKYGI